MKDIVSVSVNLMNKNSVSVSVISVLIAAERLARLSHKRCF
jgi:hypothetical protein